MKSAIIFIWLFMTASHAIASQPLTLCRQGALIPAYTSKSFPIILPIERNSVEKLLLDAFKKKEIPTFPVWKNHFLESATYKVKKELKELDHKKNTEFSEKEKNNLYPLADEKNEIINNQANVLNTFSFFLPDTAKNAFLKGNTGDIPDIISLGNSKENLTGNDKVDSDRQTKKGDQTENQRQQGSLKVKLGKRRRIDSNLSLNTPYLTPQEAAGHFLNTINKLTEKHDFSIERIIENEKRKDFEHVHFRGNVMTTEHNVKEIFVDFILYMEGMLTNQKFTFKTDTHKYRPDLRISTKNIEKIDSILSRIFSQRKSESLLNNKTYKYYYLGALLADYLYIYHGHHNEFKNKYYLLARHDAFRFFEKIFFGNGCFSEFLNLMELITLYRRELTDESRKLMDFNENAMSRNLITDALRKNNTLRKSFNEVLIGPNLKKLWLGTLNDMLEEKQDCLEQDITLDNNLNLIFGEELEYDITSIIETGSLQDSNYIPIFEDRMKKSGANKAGVGTHNLTFDGLFHITPTMDGDAWFEVNCKPYHDGEANVDSCFEKVFEVVDSMIQDGLIGYSSGHKHVDALSATHGDPSVLLELQREIESNPYLLRAFGNNDRIINDDESQWYKLFSDYSDMRGLAIERINWMIATYNEKLEGFNCEKPNGHWQTDSEKLEKLKRFSKIYSHLIQMAPLQQMFGGFSDVEIDKYMAISLLHIPGTEMIQPYGTIEFRFFRCPENLRELKLVNQFLQTWFEYIHERRKRNEPIQPVPDDVRSSKDYSTGEVLFSTVQYLQKLGLNPDDYHSFLNKIR
ncbi:hypothetical protein [Endozoicomonas sp. ONNA1]|uniref:hypothetical protein n=1 Tax=Endozoicomonas sp. ONNA1 TaxID=2828740 RepID=UPI0021483EB5|nr:hypothetical protein [Endozoicomonas sp. ONNA1]